MTKTDDRKETDSEQPGHVRSTAPQSSYSSKHVGLGIIIALIGLLITFGIPILFVG